MNGEPAEGSLRAAAEQIAPPVLNEQRSIADCAGRELGQYASIRNVYERRLSPFDCPRELPAKPPIRSGPQTPAIEMQDFDLDAQLTQAPNL